MSNINKYEWLKRVNVAGSSDQARKSSIICTIGPKVGTVEMISKLRDCGMNIVRMNFSHGDHDYHQRVVDSARKSTCSKAVSRPLAIALDTKGPEIRTGLMANDNGVTYKQGAEIIVTNNAAYAKNCCETHLYVDYPGLVRSLAVGKNILVEDGNLSLMVKSKIDENSLCCVAQNTHFLSSRKNVNLPDTNVDLPAVSEKDKADLQFAVKNKLDMVFASFIRSAADVNTIRGVLGEEGKNIMIISKIENMQGINNFDEILTASDGIMVARGDLGMEIPLEKVFVAQKQMIAKCNLAGKPVICATQMLESMTFNARPTRAEVSDVANAILDGADCVMLSGETAKGDYPLEAVTMMAHTCIEAEKILTYDSSFLELRAAVPKPVPTSEAIAMSAVSASFEHDNIGAIVVLTTSGSTARLLSKYRPAVPIIAITRNAHVARQCHLSRGVFPLIAEDSISPEATTMRMWQDNVDQRLRNAVLHGISTKLFDESCDVIAIQGWRGGPGKTNTIRILSASSILESSAPESSPAY